MSVLFAHITLLKRLAQCLVILNSEEGKVRKLLKVEPLPDGSGHFFNLSNIFFCVLFMSFYRSVYAIVQVFEDDYLVKKANWN